MKTFDNKNRKKMKPYGFNGQPQIDVDVEDIKKFSLASHYNGGRRGYHNSNVNRVIRKHIKSSFRFNLRCELKNVMY
jgi:hypothetical protein